MTIIEIVIIGIALAALFLAYQAHKNGVSFGAQAKTDVADAKTEATKLAAEAKAEATALTHDLELRVVALETKFGLIKSVPAAAPAPAAPAAVAAPAAPTVTT